MKVVRNISSAMLHASLMTFLLQPYKDHNGNPGHRTIMLHSLEEVSQLSDGNMVEFSQAPRQPPVVTQWNSFQFHSSIFQISQGFSAAAFPLALIAEMVHNLPYLFPQDPDSGTTTKQEMFNLK